MKIFILITAVISTAFALVNNSFDSLSNEILTAPERAVELSLTLMGAMAFWGGVMRVAEKSGLIDLIAGLFRPLLKRLFPDVDPNGRAFGAIVMNFAANLLGLGNAATPLGIRAIKALREEQKPIDSADTASDAMIVLVVLNTASLQLVPTTVAALRASYGSSSPMGIFPACLLPAVCALAVGLSLAVFLSKLGKSGAGRSIRSIRSIRSSRKSI